jgi:putative PIG3 family NAD(P)H quinone oxidoreductase
MRALVITQPGGPEVLAVQERPDPSPSRGEVRVRVHATAVNRADLLQRMGLYPAPPDAPPDIPGLEYAGVVDALGEGVLDLAIGDRVFGLAPGGTYAEALTVHARAVAKLPAELTFVQGAAIPEAFITAYDAMVSQGELSAGERVLIHAVGSGVGTAAVQIARAVGAEAIGTARTAEKLERARPLGMRHGVHTKGPAFADEVLAATGSEGVSVVLELVGGAYVAEDLCCLGHRGRIVVVGTLAGASVDLNLALLMRRRAAIYGTMLRSRPLEERISVMRTFARHLVPLFAAKALVAVVDRTFRLEQAGDAHAYVATNEGFGKVVLEVAS